MGIPLFLLDAPLGSLDIRGQLCRWTSRGTGPGRKVR